MGDIRKKQISATQLMRKLEIATKNIPMAVQSTSATDSAEKKHTLERAIYLGKTIFVSKVSIWQLAAGEICIEASRPSARLWRELRNFWMIAALDFVQMLI